MSEEFDIENFNPNFQFYSRLTEGFYTLLLSYISSFPIISFSPIIS